MLVSVGQPVVPRPRWHCCLREVLSSAARLLSSSQAPCLDLHESDLMISDGTAAVQGNISSWKKKEGESFGPGDVLAEIETDKVPACVDTIPQQHPQLPARLRHGAVVSLHVQLRGRALPRRVRRPAACKSWRSLPAHDSDPGRTAFCHG